VKESMVISSLCVTQENCESCDREAVCGECSATDFPCGVFSRFLRARVEGSAQNFCRKLRE
jgi:hypothetical protein